MDYSPKPFSSAAAAVLLLLTAFALAAQGQQIREAERAARERMAREAAESEEREMLLALTERYHRSGEQRNPQLAFAQIREDFVRLQIVNNDLARAVSGGGQLDLKHVAKSAAEIKKRAERLKDNLALPEAAEVEKAPPRAAPTDPEQLRTTISRLDELILRFATNLHSKGVRRFDAQTSAKMRRDLEEIIALGGQVKKCSERLEKAAPSTR